MFVPKLLQVCNVGRNTGGTAACAWTIRQCLPDWRHAVLFLSPTDPDTASLWSGAEQHQQETLSGKLLEIISPSVILFHNTRPDRIEIGKVQVPTIAYLHSNTKIVSADLTLCCSHWLAEQRSDLPRVVHQAVPRPTRPEGFSEQRFLRDELTIGRLCTPSRRKWPIELIDWYAQLGAKHSTANWEFVGCPASLRDSLARALDQRVRFHEAGWTARQHLWNWDALLYHHPTLTESFGRTVAESMRAGCIPIVDDRGGFREQIVEGTGFLCETVDDFSHAIDCLRSPSQRWSRSRHCRSHADDQFSLARFREVLLEVIRTKCR